MSGTSTLRTIAARGRQQVRRSAGLYRAYSFANPRLRDRRVTRKTDLVMDGFPRSANTYSVVAFQHANGTGPRISTHLHNGFSLIRGTKLGRPTILLVRRPGDLVTSLVHFHAALKADAVADINPAVVLAEWVDFHERLLPHLEGMLVADFTEVTGDFGRVLDSCNALFGSTFTRYDKTEENEAACREVLDAGARHFIPEGEGLERIAARPSETRKKAPVDLMADPQVASLLERATALYEQLLTEAPHRV